MPSRRLELPDAILAGTLLAIVVDAGFVIANPADAPARRVAWWIAYVAGHRWFVAFATLAAIAACRAIPPKARRYLAPLLAWVTVGGLLFVVMEEDLESFEVTVRAGVAAGVGLGFGVLAATRVWSPPPSWLRAALAAVGVGALVANQMLLELNYPGFHLGCIALSQVALGLTVADAVVPVPSLRRRSLSRPGRWVRDAALAIWAAASVVVPPKSSISTLLAADDSAPLYRFASELYPESMATTPGLADEFANNPYFRSRATAPAIPPGAPILPRDSLLVAYVSLDAFRYDVGSGKREVKLPTLERLKAEGVSFEQAYAPATSTSGSLSSIFMGRYFSQTEWSESTVHDRRVFLPVETDNARFPTYLTEAGVATYSVPTHWRASKMGRMVQGFAEEFDVELKGHRYSEEALPVMASWLGRPRTGPAFAFCHLMDAHAPYNHATTEGNAFERYMAELALADREIGNLVTELELAGVWDHTILIVSSDHGESFGEHRLKNHTGPAFQEQIHVPLVIRIPGANPRSVSEPVTLIDLGPTILDLFGVDTPGYFMGESLAPILRGEPASFTRPVAFDTAKGQFGIVFSDFVKASYTPRKKRAEVYDLKSDPFEKHNRADEDWAQKRLGAVRAFFDAHEFRKPGYKVPGR